MVFRHKSARINHRYTHFSSPPKPPSRLPPHPTLSLSQSPCLRSLGQQISIGYLSYIWYCKFPCYSLHIFPLLPPPSPQYPQVYSLCLFLHCCPENKFISTIFLDSIYMHQYMTLIFLFLTYFTLYNRL